MTTWFGSTSIGSTCMSPSSSTDSLARPPRAAVAGRHGLVFSADVLGLDGPLELGLVEVRAAVDDLSSAQKRRAGMERCPHSFFDDSDVCGVDGVWALPACRGPDDVAPAYRGASLEDSEGKLGGKSALGMWMQ